MSIQHSGSLADRYATTDSHLQVNENAATDIERTIFYDGLGQRRSRLNIGRSSVDIVQPQLVNEHETFYNDTKSHEEFQINF